MSKSGRTILIAAASALAAGCHPASPTSPGKIAGFSVAWTASPPALTVHSSDGRELLSTAGALFESQTNTATYNEEEGSFQVTEPAVAWNEPKSLKLTSGSQGELDFDVAMSGGHTGTIRVFGRGTGVLAVTLTTDGANRIRTGFACADSDHFLGFGAQTDAIDHHGHLIPIFTSEPGIGKTDNDSNLNDPTWFLEGARHQASYPLPTFLSSRGFSFLADTTDYTIFDVCQTDPTRWTVENWNDTVTLDVYDGPTPAEAIERLTADTGRQPLANDLALAPWNDAIFGSTNVRNIAAELRANHIPSSAIWTEDFRGGYEAGTSYHVKEEWDVDRTLYPDIEQLASDLHSEGFRFFAYHNTFLTSGTNILTQAQAAGVLIKNPDGTDNFFEGSSFVNAGLVDLTNPAGAAFVKQWLNTFAGYGFDGWMADFAEWQPIDGVKLFNGDPETEHNRYPMLYDQINAQVFAALPGDPNTRDYFVRSGCIRDAPFQPVVWGGDQLTLFDQNDGFPTALMRGLNLGLGGIAIYGSDVAGYQNADGPPSTMELFYRWTTLGALSTVMRTHHGVEAMDNWQWFTDADSTAHFARWAQFHAQLWPYLKSAAAEAFNNGMPIMRVMPLVFPDDANVWTMTDEYMFGDHLLVAPVLTQGATSRNIYFPAGMWFPWAGGPVVTGPVSMSVDLPLTEIGLYASAGSIVSMLPPLDTLMPADPPLVTLDMVRNQRIVQVFGGAQGNWTDVDGTSFLLTSQPNWDVVSISHTGPAIGSGDQPLSSCSTSAPPCGDIDGSSRLVVVKFIGTESIGFRNASGSASVLTVMGGSLTTEVDFHY